MLFFFYLPPRTKTLRRAPHNYRHHQKQLWMHKLNACRRPPAPSPSAIVPRIFVPRADNTTLTLQWRANNGVAQLGLKGHDNKCDKLRSDAARKERKTEREKKKGKTTKTFHPIQMWEHQASADELLNLGLT